MAEDLLQKIPQPSNKFQDYLKNPNQCSIFLDEVDQGEVFQLLSKLDDKKSGDFYNNTPFLVKLCAKELAENLTIIYNISFNTGTFPDHLKLAQIIPLHKKGPRDQVGNYRPISLLPIFGKILEKLMFNRIYSFITDKKILSPSQFGFQVNKSTEQAILKLQSFAINAIEEKDYACSIFLDFAKAFDTVNHNILLRKLDYYGIRGHVNDWFKSYLINRKQCVKLCEYTSDFEVVKHGVPQGSILGPLLFLVYINDIVLSSKIFKFLLFADDTCLLLQNKSFQEL